MEMDELMFFNTVPERIPLYEAIREALVGVGDVHIKVAKTQISFSDRYMFAAVSLPRRKKDKGLLLTLGLPRRVNSERIWQATEPYPGRWTHHILIVSSAELDEEMLSLIKEGREFSVEK